MLYVTTVHCKGDGYLMCRRIFCCCILLMLVCFFSCCTYTGMNDSLEIGAPDDSTKLRLEKLYGRESGNHLTWYTEECRSGLEGARYYGRYGYFDVWLAVIDTVVPMEKEIAGITFCSEYSFALYASNGIELYGLEYLYNSLQLITKEDIAAIALIHQKYEDRIIERRSELDGTEESPNCVSSEQLTLPILSDSKKTELKKAHQEAFGVTPCWDDQAYSDFRYYGSYDGCEVFFQSTMLTVFSEQTIAEENFTHSGTFMLYAFRADEWKSLEDAYDYGWVSAASIVNISKIHEEYEKRISEGQ